MKILAIETSCDETAISIVEAEGGLRQPRFKVLKNFVASQIKTHRPYGGVVPNLAKREHLKNLPILLAKLTKNYRLETINLICVTVGPGLEPCLWTGIEFAKKLAKELKKPLVGANHMEGHLFSNWLPPIRKSQISPPKADPPRAENLKSQNLSIIFPAVALVVSGGHTILLKMDSLIKWKKLGETRDDAAGEAFDKVARLLGLLYPGGPEIEKLALRQARGKQKKGTIEFPRPMLNQKNYEFSFSGLKTSVLYCLRDNAKVNKADIAASFQTALVDVLVKKTMRAAREFGAKSVLLSGGVAANKSLRENFAIQAARYKLQFHAPLFEYNTDNAAMIAAAAYIKHLQKKRYKLSAQANLNL